MGVYIPEPELTDDLLIDIRSEPDSGWPEFTTLGDIFDFIAAGGGVGRRPVTMTNRSGSIALGGQAQVLAPANATRQVASFQNLSPYDMYINDAGGTASPGEGSFWVPAGAYWDTKNPASAQALSVWGPVTGQQFTCEDG